MNVCIKQNSGYGEIMVIRSDSDLAKRVVTQLVDLRVKFTTSRDHGDRWTLVNYNLDDYPGQTISVAGNTIVNARGANARDIRDLLGKQQ